MLSLAGSIYVAYFLIKDYEDPQEVEKMRKKALVLDFPSLIREHGSIDQILEGKVLTHKELKGKINQAVTSAQKIHSEELPRLLQFQKQINARKDPEEKKDFFSFFTKFFS